MVQRTRRVFGIATVSAACTCEPLKRDRALGSFRRKLAVEDGTAGRKLHREPSVVLVVDDRARIGAQLGFAGNEVAKGVDSLTSDQTFPDRLQQLDLAIGADAVPVVDD